MLLCIAGDCHGQINQMYRLIEALEEQAERGPVDLVVQVGDFGIWPNPDRIDKATRNHEGAGDFPQWYRERRSAPRKTVFIAGNHEDFNFLRERQAPEKRAILPNLHFLPWGEVETFDVNGQDLRIGGIGGCYAESNFESKTLVGKNRKNYRLGELKQIAEQRSPQIDLLVLHDSPSGTVQEVAARGRGYCKTSSAEGLSELIALVQPRLTVTGHLHVRSERRIAGVRTIGMGIIPRGENGSPGSLLLMDLPPAPAEPVDLIEHGFDHPAIVQETEIENEAVQIHLLADEFIEALTRRGLQWAEQIVGKGRLDKSRDRQLKELLQGNPYGWLLTKAIRHTERPWLARLENSACWREIHDRMRKGHLSVGQIEQALKRWEEMVPEVEGVRQRLV